MRYTHKQALYQALKSARRNGEDYVIVPSIEEPDKFIPYLYSVWLANPAMRVYTIRVCPDGSRHTV